MQVMNTSTNINCVVSRGIASTRMKNMRTVPRTIDLLSVGCEVDFALDYCFSTLYWCSAPSYVTSIWTRAPSYFKKALAH